MVSPVEARVGDTLRLKCRASGKPRPLITWYLNGETIREEDSDKYVVEGYTLRLERVLQRDAGEYTCQVYNKAGNIQFTHVVQVLG